jgi:hypothetical protein
MKQINRRDALRMGAFGSLAAVLGNPALEAAASQVPDVPGRLVPIQTLTAPDERTSVLRFGVGFNWVDRFPVDGPAPVYPALDDKAGWDAVRAALDELRPGFLRFWIETDACVGDAPGRIKTSAPTFDRAQIVSDWVEKTDCTLLLDTSHVPKQFQFEQTATEKKASESQPFLEMAAKDNRAFTRDFIVPLLRHILVDRKMNGFKYYNAYNEPLQYGPFSTPNNAPDPYVHYVDMYREIQTQLKAAGLYPDRIRLAGVEAIEPSAFPALQFLARGVDIDPYIDMYTIHYYFHRLDWMNPVPFLPETVENAIDRGTPPLVDYCKRRGKPLMAAEIGWYANDNDPYPMPTDPLASSRHQATLITAENMVRGINAGLTGFGIWSLFNHGAFDGAWQVISYRKGRIEKAEHPYAMYRLFSRYARPGSRVFPLAVEQREWPWQYVYATSLLTPEDKTVVYAVNDHLGESRRIHLRLPAAWAGRRLRKIVKDNERLSVETDIVRLKPEDGHTTLVDLLYASSLTAYVEES